MEFPERIYTDEEIEKARKMVKKGYKHCLTIDGGRKFKEKVDQSLKLVRTAGYYDFLRRYIRKIVEIDGITQLREAEAEIWVNNYAVKNPVDAASLFIQKANHMKEYLEGKLHFDGAAESRAIQKRIKFLRALKNKSQRKEIKKECKNLLKSWTEAVFL